jgi:hypothetical protein
LIASATVLRAQPVATGGKSRSFYHGTTALSFDMQTMSMRALWQLDQWHIAAAGIDERLKVRVALTLAGPAGEMHADVGGARRGPRRRQAVAHRGF